MDERSSEGRRARRRRREDLREVIYRTRREWIIGELLLGIASCAAAMAGVLGGLIDQTLARTDNNLAWFLCFYLSGSTFVMLSYIESRCRAHCCGRDVLIRYAYLRFATHAVNFFAWGMAFLWLHFSELHSVTIYWEAIPFAVANFWGMVEHAKALWLRPSEARTTSLLQAGARLLRGG